MIAVPGPTPSTAGCGALLEALNRDHPRTPEVLRRLVQACEQERDYGAAAGYLRAVLRLRPDDDGLLDKRRRYQALGAW